MDEPTTRQADHTQDEVQRRGRLVLEALPVLLIPASPFLIGLVMLLIVNMTVGLPEPPIGGPPPIGFPAPPLGPAAALIVLCGLLALLVHPRRPELSAMLLIGMWAVGSAVIMTQGGVSGSLPALLLIPICAAGLLLGRAASIGLAVVATVLVTGLASLERRGLAGLPNPAGLDYTPAVAAAPMYWVALFWTIAALTSLLAGDLQRALRRSREQARQLQTLSAQLEARVAEQTARLLEQERAAATLEERARLARDIHDTLAQGLTSIVVQLGAAQQILSSVTMAADEQIALAQRMARESLAEARRSVWNLRSPALERGDLSDALRGLADRPVRPEMSISFAQEGAVRPLQPAVDSALLRVAQEGLANAAKHAGATRVELRLSFDEAAVRLEIRDNGRGFDPVTIEAGGALGPGGGFGLRGMRERIEALGGRLQICGSGGVTIVATVPRGASRSALSVG